MKQYTIKHETNYEYKILNKIKEPRDIKQLSFSSLNILCSELRHKIISTVSNNGGHLASNLGVVELTVAIHKNFNSPEDKIIWDVGHQCYTHKLLTGRFSNFNTLRQENGISGFTKPSENKHDIFISGHASTSISAACGFAKAEMLKGNHNMVIAVIGDGALTGGMAYEALNNAQNLNNLIVILNYNDMSISKTVGGLSRYISNLRSNQVYLDMNSVISNFIAKIPLIGKITNKTICQSKQTIKKIVHQSNFFTELGFTFLSSVNGHDIHELLQAFNWAKQVKRPALIQVFTKKGKGYPKAEKKPDSYHGVEYFDMKKGIICSKDKASFSKVFGDLICYLAENDKRICAITAAMEHGTGLLKFHSKFPNRFSDVGIAEQHAVTYAAGLSSSGLLPVFAVYSTFLQRAYDQIMHDVAIQNEHVIIAVDRAGLVGEDGETHQGIFDVSFLTSTPNIIIYSPSNYFELKETLQLAIYNHEGLVVVRYPKGQEDPILNKYNFSYSDYAIIGKSKTLILTYGRITGHALRSRDYILKKTSYEVAVIKMVKIFPIPSNLIYELKNYDEIFFFEEGIENGGIGEKIIKALYKNEAYVSFELTAIKNKFIKQSSVDSALRKLGLDFYSMSQKILTNSKHLKKYNKNPILSTV